MVKYYSPQVEPLKNGKFKYSIRYTDPSFVGVKKSSTTMTKDTTHSRKLADEVVKKKIKNKLNKIDIKRITVKDLLKKLKANLSEQGLAPKTLNTYFSFFNRFSRHFSTRVVDSISSTELNVYFNDLLYKEKLSNGTVSKYRILVAKIFDYAVQFGYTKS
ncbi:phage integrase N-terminal SAM-like domain-containing protein, partial [Lactobacillus taiwanensis]